jgi:hypothetical protein
VVTNLTCCHLRNNVIKSPKYTVFYLLYISAIPQFHSMCSKQTRCSKMFFSPALSGLGGSNHGPARSASWSRRVPCVSLRLRMNTLCPSSRPCLWGWSVDQCEGSCSISKDTRGFSLVSDLNHSGGLPNGWKLVLPCLPTKIQVNLHLCSNQKRTARLESDTK